jgi:hypothetical protein
MERRGHGLGSVVLRTARVFEDDLLIEFVERIHAK